MRVTRRLPQARQRLIRGNSPAAIRERTRQEAERDAFLFESDGLREQIADMAKDLQELTENRNNAQKALDGIFVRKETSQKELDAIEDKIVAKKKELENLISEIVSVENKSEKRIKDAKERAKFNESLAKVISEAVTDMVKVKGGLENFIQQAGDAREKFLRTRTQLGEIKKDKQEFLDDYATKKAELAEQKKELERYGDYLKEFAENLTGHVTAAKEVIEYVNVLLEEHRLPAKYEMPTDVEIIKF